MVTFLLQFGGLVSEINRLLNMRFLPGHPNNSTPIGEVFTTILNSHNANQLEKRDHFMARMALLVKNLNEIEKERPDLIPIFRREVKKAKNTDGFFGVRFEINAAASLIRKGVDFEKRESPDFQFEYEGTTVSIECTSARIRSNKGSPDVYYKISSCIRKKEKIGYHGESTALFIDITNLMFEIFLNGGEPDSERLREVIKESMSEESFGSVVLFVLMLNKDTMRYESNYIRCDHSTIGEALYCFLNNEFPFGKHTVYDVAITHEG